MRKNILNGFVLGVVCFLITGFAESVDAASTIAKVGTGPERLGYGGQYQISGMQSFPYTLVWTGRQNDGCVSAWAPVSGTTDTVNIYYPIPGTFQLRCLVTYSSIPGPDCEEIPAPPPETVTYNYTIAEPDSSSIISGLSVGTAFTQTSPTAASLNGAIGCLVIFKVLVGGNDVGPMVTMTAQESITNLYLGGVLQSNQGWVPVSQPDVRFYLASTGSPAYAVISDFKYLAVSNPTVGVLMTYTQENRVVWTDYCGTVHTKSVGSYNFKGVITTTTTWETQL